MALMLLTVTTLCYAAALWIHDRPGKRSSAIAAAAIATFVIYLAAFKALDLFASGRSIFVPLGISYYTFRLISYLIEVYWQRLAPEKDWTTFAAYVAFFPQMVAGPIQRPADFLSQIHAGTPVTPADVWTGILRILLGFFKKFLVADKLALLVAYGFSRAGQNSCVPSALAMYLFPLQLYMDFGALTDIAVGISLLFGIRSPENFDRPFGAVSITEFWRRWHMSLTGWLRDYVFTPTRMTLRNLGQTGLAISIVVNMMLVAVWHGFRSTFVLFGVLHSVYLLTDTFSAPFRKKLYREWPALKRIAGVLGVILTYHLVAVADVFFRASTPGAAIDVLAGLGAGLDVRSGLIMAMAPPNHWTWSAFPFAAAAATADAFIRRGAAVFLLRSPRWARWCAASATSVLAVVLILSLMTSTRQANPFFYEQF